MRLRIVPLLAAIIFACAEPSHAKTRQDRAAPATEQPAGDYADGYKAGHLAGYEQAYTEGFDTARELDAAEIAGLEGQVSALEAQVARLRAEVARLSGGRGDGGGDDGGGRGDGGGDFGGDRGDPDDTRGARDPRPTNLPDKTGYGSGWGNSADAVYLRPTHPLVTSSEGGVHTVELADVRLRPGYRSGLMSTMGDTAARYRLEIADAEIQPLDPNGPAQNWGGTGTLWGGRAYGIHSGTVDNVWIEDWFGDSYANDVFTSREGHGFYFTLSQTPGAVLTFSDLRFENLGGHALHFATAFGDRAGNAPAPQKGGKVVIDHCDFIQTDRCQARGAYAVSMYHAHAAVTISNSNIVQDQPVSKNGSLSGGLRSRGAIQAEGLQESLRIVNVYVDLASPSDRTAQVWIEGPDFVLIEGSTFNCQEISVNDPYGDGPSTIKTKRFIFRGCEGAARVKWNGQVLGTAGDLNGEWLLQ